MTPDIDITGICFYLRSGFVHWQLDFTLNGQARTAVLDDAWMLDRTDSNNLDIREYFSSDAEEALVAALEEYVAEHDAELSRAEADAEQLTEPLEQLKEHSNLDYDLLQLPKGQGYELRLFIEMARRRVAAYVSAAEAQQGLQQIMKDTAPVLKRLNANIPQALHDRFKITCAQHGKVMGDVVVALIRDWCAPSVPALEDPDGILLRCGVELSTAESERLIAAGRFIDDLDDTVRDWPRDDLLWFAKTNAEDSDFRTLVDGFLIDADGHDLDFELSRWAMSALYSHAYVVCTQAVLERLADLLDAD
jgi:hypothetical protein